ncbi:MAG TPA: lipoprotein [Gammaproteobacteria bacterium]|nr:lipoprotein [Gammaproteobacteria bacterium]
MRLCWAQILFIVVIAVLGLGSMLSACGQKGPLYLPGHASHSAQQDSR